MILLKSWNSKEQKIGSTDGLLQKFSSITKCQGNSFFFFLTSFDDFHCRASDVWSFGVLLWEMCERKLPYDGLSNAQVMEGVCKQGLRLSTTNFPAGLAALMQRCWTEPEKRPSFEEIFVILQQLLKE